METMSRQLARFVVGCTFEQLTPLIREATKIRVLDSLGCAWGAAGGGPIPLLRRQIEDFGGRPRCTLIGGGRTAPDLAAFYNGARVRYLDFNDSYLAPRETCHPSDNLGAVLAAAEYARAGGKTLMLALAVAYQIQCRLSDVAPVRARGFDHTTQGSYAAAAGVAKALGLDEDRTADAIAMAGTALNALRVTRTGRLSHWKGLAYPFTGFAATHLAFLAMRGVTGPPEVFEGNKGFMDAVAGRFEIDWAAEGLDRIAGTIIKKYNAEVHSQSTIEGALELQRETGFQPSDIERLEIEIFDVAYNIIGGGEEGGKQNVATKEEADHSLPYIIAAALLDGTIMPPQYEEARIRREDVQSLLRRIAVRPREDFSRRFPGEMPCRLVATLRDGRVLEKEKRDYEGFLTRPTTWEQAAGKFKRLSAAALSPDRQSAIIEIVAGLEKVRAGGLPRLLAGGKEPHDAGSRRQ
ncbi:MAG: MmgE/PrpD family protein [bacterium]|nr:MmgE/PrpD family protein [bacterium]